MNLNGQKVGDHVLDPVQTNYDDYAFYVTYNITRDLHKGANAVGIMVGDGWYNQDVVWGGNMNYGIPRVICQINVVFEDGTQETIQTNKDWRWTNGPIIKSNVYAGEIYDARKEIEGWSTSSPEKTDWMKVKLASHNPPVLKAQMIPPIKKIKELRPQDVFKVDDHTYIFDFGQNFAGWVRLHVKAPKGTEVMLRSAEQIFPDSTLNPKSTGVKATHVVQTEKYITKGSGNEAWEPRFTYHGFRYVEVSGLSDVNKDMLTGIVVHSDVPKAGQFKTSNPQINRLHKIANWTFTSNLYGLPTDCPTREKAGWLGDAQTIAQTAIYNYNMEAFFRKYLHDIRSSAQDEVKTVFFKQENSARYRRVKPSGIPFMVSPGKRRIGAASPDWGTTLVQLPWYLYLYYGDKRTLRDFYPEMKQWVDYVENLNSGYIAKTGLGDWCPPGGNKERDTPIPITSTAFHYLDTKIMAKSATVLGHPDDATHYRKLGKKIKKAFQDHFYDSKKKSFDSQTANAMALKLGLVPRGQSVGVSDATKTLIKKNKNFITTGIFGLSRIFGALSEFGNADAVFRLITKKGANSFSYMWNHYDATTLWEILPVGKGKYSGGGSHNHAMQGGYDAWFYQGILGINPDFEHPGFKHIILKPVFFNQLKWAKGSFDSPYGIITSNWSWESNELTWHIAVPPSTTAELKLSYDFADTLYVDQLQVKGSKNINSEGVAYYHYDLKSGQHNIRMIR